MLKKLAYPLVLFTIVYVLGFLKPLHEIDMMVFLCAPAAYLIVKMYHWQKRSS